MLTLASVLLWTSVAAASSASVVYRGSQARKQIALTFDDNTSPDRALAVLRALQRYRVPATLFVIGSSVRSFPSINNEIVKGMTSGLFEVGDHTWSHPVLTGLSEGSLASQIGGGTDAFRKATGARTVPLFRPPYGATNSRVAAAAAADGFKYLVLWDVDPRDWAAVSARAVADHVVSRAHNGAIVVMHLSGRYTAAAIPDMVSRLRDKGYELVTVSEMLKGERLFLDIDEDSETGKAIARMVASEFMSGYDGNYFGPSDTITRAQVAKVAVLVGGIHTPEVERAEAPTFADVALRHDSQGNPVSYPFDFVEEAAAAGLVAGSPGSEGALFYKPESVISRVQFAQILARMARELKGYQGADKTFDDAPHETLEARSLRLGDVPGYAVADVSLVLQLGLMSGYSSDRFNSWAGAQRGDVAFAMSRYLDLPEVRQEE